MNWLWKSFLHWIYRNQSAIDKLSETLEVVKKSGWSVGSITSPTIFWRSVSTNLIATMPMLHAPWIRLNPRQEQYWGKRCWLYRALVLWFLDQTFSCRTAIDNWIASKMEQRILQYSVTYTTRNGVMVVWGFRPKGCSNYLRNYIYTIVK